MKFLVTIPLLTTLLSVNGQVNHHFSPDSLVNFMVYENPNYTTKMNFSDSLKILSENDTVDVHNMDYRCVLDSECDSIRGELWSANQIFKLPRMVRCVKLANSLYALIGYTTMHPVHVKHIWILDLKEQMNITHRFGLICRRTLDYGIDFRYDANSNEILLFSSELALIGDHIYRYGACYCDRQNINITDLNYYEYSIWMENPDDKFFKASNEKIIRIKI